MKHLFSILFIFVLHFSIAQCNPSKEKMMVIGDSWAFFSWTGNSYNENLDRFGFSDVTCYSTINLAVNGAEASDYFTDPNRVQELEDYILGNPDLEYVHMSLGGNDALGTWHKDFTSQQTSDLLDTILVDIKNGIDTILSFNPNLTVVIAGYDYANFSETVGALPAPAQPFHPFYDTWDGMGQPNPEELNGILQLATDRFEDSAAVWNNVEFENNLGLMQWVYGQIDPLQVAPYGTYPPNTAPLPGGYNDYPSPLDALNFGGQDAFHLNDDAYEEFIKKYFIQYYWNQFRDYHHSTSANDTNLNGTLTANSTNSATILVGNENFEERKGLISFNTSDFDDNYTIEHAALYIQRDSADGDDLAGIDVDLEIKSGFFGATINLENDDFTATGDESVTLCTYGTIDENGHWMRIELPPTMFQHIDANGTTQFKLSYNIGDSSRYISFGNQFDQAMLDVRYTETPSATIIKEDLDFSIYPNPTNGLIKIAATEQINSIQLFNLKGQLIMSKIFPTAEIDLTNTPAGIYILQVDLNGEIKQQKVLKR